VRASSTIHRSRHFTNNGNLDFSNASTAGNAVITGGGGLQFLDTSTAGNASISYSGILQFLGTSTAGNANIINGYVLRFGDTSTAGNASITNNSIIDFNGDSTAGDASITNNDVVHFGDTSTAGNAIITNNSPLFSGGALQFVDNSNGGQARFINNSGAIIDFSGTAGLNNDGRLSTGSIEGAGNYYLGSNELTVGGSNLSTTVSGIISDHGPQSVNLTATGGSIIKTGTGTLTLTGTNTYTGGTTLDGGTLSVTGNIPSSSGATIDAGGTLEGSGTVATTAVNDGGTLAPGNSVGTLTISGNLVLTSGANYLIHLSSSSASETIVTGTTSVAGIFTVAPISGSYSGSHTYTVLYSTGLLSGTFSSLPPVSAGGATFSVSYDAHDVFLTVVVPAVTSVTATSDSGATDLNVGHVVTISVKFNESAYVTGNPYLMLNDNEVATYVTGSGTDALTFAYTVQQGDNIPDLQVTGVNLNGGTIQDVGGTPLFGLVQGDLALQIDTVGPQVQSFTASDRLLTNANVVHYALTFSEPVTGVNASDFSLVTTGVTGASIASVTPVGGSNGEQYTVAVNTGTGSGTVELDLSGAGIQDLAGNPLPGGTFQPQLTYPAGAYPLYITIGDVNRDGKLDLAIVNYLDNTVSVLLGNGDSTFQDRTTYATGPNPDSVAIGDVNGDGKSDLVVANQSYNDQHLLTVSVLLGNGDGTFQSQISNTADAGGFSVAIGDLYGDGIPDAVVPNIWSNTVSVLLGNGDGTFRNPIINLTGASPFSVAIGDLNGDGKPDLVVSNESSNTLSVLLGNGDGTFQAQTTYATGSVPNSVAISDLNGDGKLDVVVANADDTVSVLLGNGDGTFQAQTTYATGLEPFSVAIGDMNGDGKLDLVVANSVNTVSVLLGNGDGTFQPQITYATGPAPSSVAIGDVNGDGRPDLVVANWGNNTASVLLNNAPAFVGSAYTIDKTAPTVAVSIVGSTRSVRVM
jgi:autotransporter-associated beta strand protein